MSYPPSYYPPSVYTIAEGNRAVMKVNIDGVLHQRFVDYIDVVNNYRAIPELLDGEQAIWTVCSDIPLIVKVK